MTFRQYAFVAGITVAACADRGEQSRTPETLVAAPQPPKATAEIMDVTSQRYAGVMHPFEFRRGEEIRVPVAVRGAQPGSELKLLWKASDGRTLNEVEHTLDAGANVVLVSGDTASWPRGQYALEALIDDRRTDTTLFVIE